MTANLNGLEKVLKALANKRRIAIVQFIRAKREAHVGDIAEDIRLSFKSTSHHIGILSSAGILTKDQRGLRMYYRIASDLPAIARRIISAL